MVAYGEETGVINKSDEKTLMTSERKMLRNLFGLSTEDNQWRIRSNVELELYKDVSSTGTFIKLQSLRWVGHLQRINDARNAKKIYQAKLHKKRCKGRSTAGWEDDVENDVRKIGIVKCIQVAQDKDGRRRAARDALVLLGYWRHRTGGRGEEEGLN